MYDKMQNNKKILKIVLTGGPCGGKSTALKNVKDYFSKLEYNIFDVSEVATELISKGIKPDKLGRYEFQKKVFQWQIEKENIYIKKAMSSDNMKKTIILFDRGALDGGAYLQAEQFNYMISEENFSKKELFKRYDKVIHLMSTAKDAPEKYHTINNMARVEDVGTSAMLDDKLYEIWKQHNNFTSIDNKNGFDYKTDKIIKEINKEIIRVFKSEEIEQTK